ncbi:DoxX family protein [Alkalihalobacillus hwajinpoensis]|uniref:DoxX family protein n=1 Tax=Guptibacillus hwajinpoensis TaxID=208199 RepID=UPI0018847A38|nr:DoxX family protein [Pseudalkalibacillus hwajinpoensis]MBF0705325.1 DoxX family protein [Pseudalkalibacillus hwajinpoensis]
MNLSQNVALVVLRIVLGLIFTVHGLDKFAGGIGNTAGFFESIGILGGLAYVVATIELVGGLLMIVGLGTRIVSFLFIIVMLGAIFTVKLTTGFIGGYELDLALLGMSVAVLIGGGGTISADYKFFSKQS